MNNENIAGRTQQLVAALIILAVALWIAFVSFNVEDPQPYLFPRLFSGVMAALALAAVVRAARGRNKTGKGLDRRLFLKILPGVAIMALYAFWLAEALGFYAAAFVCMLAIYCLYDPNPHRRWRTWAVRLAVTAGFVAFVHVVFALGLKVRTPEGILI